MKKINMKNEMHLSIPANDSKHLIEGVTCGAKGKNIWSTFNRDKVTCPKCIEIIKKCNPKLNEYEYWIDDQIYFRRTHKMNCPKCSHENNLVITHCGGEFFCEKCKAPLVTIGHADPCGARGDPGDTGDTELCGEPGKNEQELLILKVGM